MRYYIKVYIVSLARVILKLGYIFPIKKKRILFSSYEGLQYTCNPKYLFQGLFDSLDKSYDYIWVLNDRGLLPKKYHGKVKTVKYLSPKHIYYLLTSEFIISNLGIEPIIPKRKSQVFINTWHGGGAYKRVSADMSMFTEPEKYYIKKMRDFRKKDTTYFLSSCERFTEVSSQDFFINKFSFISSGLPRNDRFFCTSPEKRLAEKKVFCASYGVPIDNLIVLYAPTFRGSHRKQEHIDDQVCSAKVSQTLKERFNKSVTFLFRSHISKDLNLIENENSEVNMIDVTKYPDMQDLLDYADILITDYSSSIWDYCITFKPGFLFVPDLKKYELGRGFYIPISSWPYPYAESVEELCDKIKYYSLEDNENRIKTHQKELGTFERGNALQCVIKLIENKC